MTGYSDILVLIADEKKATLSITTDGATRLLRTIERVLPGGYNEPDARHTFACQLMMALSCGISEHTYDGIVIFAEAPMMTELRKVKTGPVSRALLAELVGKPFEANFFPALHAANAQTGFRGMTN